MARHVFAFDGGADLTTMGACWFVSYCYNQKIDPNHRNWQNVGTANRISVFNKTQNKHRYYLERVLEMNDVNLNKNRIGLSSVRVKEMARDLLQNW